MRPNQPTELGYTEDSRAGRLSESIAAAQNPSALAALDADGDGVADNAAALGGVAAANYLRKDIDETVTGHNLTVSGGYISSDALFTADLEVVSGGVARFTDNGLFDSVVDIKPIASGITINTGVGNTHPTSQVAFGNSSALQVVFSNATTFGADVNVNAGNVVLSSGVNVNNTNATGRLRLAAADAGVAATARISVDGQGTNFLSLIYGKLTVNAGAGDHFGAAFDVQSPGTGVTVGDITGLSFFGGLASGDTADNVFGARYTAFAYGTVNNLFNGLVLVATASSGTTAADAVAVDISNQFYGASTAPCGGLRLSTDLGVSAASYGIKIEPPTDSSFWGVCDDWAGIILDEQGGDGGAPLTVADSIRINEVTWMPGATRGNVRFVGGNWNTGHLQLEFGHAWNDATNNVIRFKGSAPASETDGFAHFDNLNAVSGATPATLGNTGGGPAGAAQSGWLRVYTPSGARYVPCWT